METYEILLHGKRIRLLNEETQEVCIGGVWVWRIAKADSKEAAISKAVEHLWKDSRFTEEIFNGKAEEIIFAAEEVNLSPSWREPEDTAPVFYIDTLEN